MATVFTAGRGASTFPVAGGAPAGVVHAMIGNIADAANPTAADTYVMGTLPKHAVVIGGRVWADVLDTNATETLDMDLGWQANGTDVLDADGFGDLGLWKGDLIATFKPVVMVDLLIQNAFIAGPRYFAAETVIQFTCVATAATFAAGSMSVRLDYIIDPNYSAG